MTVKVHELKAERGAVIDQMVALTSSRDFDPAKHAELKASVEKIDAQIRALDEAEALSRTLARPSGANSSTGLDLPAAEHMRTALGVEDWTPPSKQTRSFNDCLRQVRKETGFATNNNQTFRGLGEQLQAIYAFAESRGSSCDSRLVRAPSGGSEVDPSGGGFVVQTDFEQAIFALAHDMGEIMSRVTKLPISANANGVKIPGIDETSRATGSRWGGVQSYWAAEGTSVTASKPKFRLVEYDLKKLFSVAYITDELLQDSTALTSIYGQAFSEELTFMTEDAVFEGSGAGQPLGILNSPALVTVPKESGQIAGTVVKENIDKMWSRMSLRQRKNAVWFINQDLEPYLQALNGVVGTGGQLVYQPPGGISAAPYATLYGKPIVATEYNSALGAPGDIALLDLSQYYLADKGGVQSATSMHINFLTDEMAFRFTYRVDGKPIWHNVITPFKGTLTKSPFVVLAQR
jgi:HK97 family phage major capsid protein